MDWLGLLLLIPVLVLTLFTISIGPSFSGGWKSAPVLGTLIGGVLTLFAFVCIELRIAKYPLIPFEKLRIPGFCLIAANLFLAGGGFGVFMQYSMLL